MSEGVGVRVFATFFSPYNSTANIMTTLDKIHPFASAPPSGSLDFVSSDIAALATHMNNCASTRSRFFGLHSVLETAHSAVCARMVTAAIVALLLMSVVGVV
jgi:hypothetical protein